MNCAKVKEQLSAYFDRESPVEVEAAIASHLEECSACALEFAGFHHLSELTAKLANPPLPDSMWEQFESVLDHQDDVNAPSASPHGYQFQISKKLFAIAATLLIAAVLFFFAYQKWNAPDEHEHLAVSFDHYLEEFEENPHKAQQILISEYDGQPTTLEKAAQVLKYEPVIAKGLPTGCSLENVYLLDMPCCHCAQAVCKCKDGQLIAVFEHDLDQPVWFGDRPKISCLCHGKDTNVVQVDGRLAATWKEGNRYITIIGARDLAEVTRFVAHFSGQNSNG